MALHLRADLQDRYRRFIERVRTECEVWLLVDPEMHGAWVESNEFEKENGEPVVVHLVFSTAAYARQHANGAWANMTPRAMDIESFFEGPLRHMNESGDLIGPDFNSDLAGVEVEPIELIQDVLELDDDPEDAENVGD